MNPHLLRAALERELTRRHGENWRTPLPPNASPLQVIEAWERDAELTHAAHCALKDGTVVEIRPPQPPRRSWREGGAWL